MMIEYLLREMTGMGKYVSHSEIRDVEGIQ